MPTGFELLGEALAGPSEKAFQEGRFIGARTEDALAEAQRRVDENRARETLASSLESVLPPQVARASADALRAGANLGDVIQMLGRQQEQGFRATAGSADPNVGAAERNRALFGVASGPVQTLEPVGSRGFTDILAPEKGVMPLGDELIGGGGDAAAIQILRAFGQLDESGRVRDPARAFDIMRTTQRVIDEGGVPSVISANPFAGRPPGAPPSAVPPGAPAAVPPGAPAAVPAGAPPSAVPVSSAERVAQNVSTIEAAKIAGRGTGEARADLPKFAAQWRNTVQEADRVQNTIKQAVTNTDFLSAGIAGWASRGVPGTPGFQLARLIDNIKANVGFRGLKQMRYESPTGGALGQVAVLELQFLQAALGNLDTAQNPDQLVAALQQVDEAYDQYRENAQADFQAAAASARGDFESAASITAGVLSKYPDLAPAAGPGAPGVASFATEAEAAAAAAQNRIRPGDRIIVNGVSGTWQ